MKQLLLWCLCGLIFGFVSGCVGMEIAYQETLPDPTQEHWYDIVAIFSCPGIGLTWAFFHPADGYYGDIWDNRDHIVLFNSLSSTLIALFFFSVASIGRALIVDIKSLRRKYAR